MPRRSQHARRGGIDAWRERGLHAAFQHQHASRVHRRGPRARIATPRNRCSQRAWQQRAHRAPGAQQRAEYAAIRHRAAQRPALQALRWRPADARMRDLASDIEQSTVLHPRGTCRFAGAAAQAAVEVHLRHRRGRGAPEHLLDQVDAAARAVEFVPSNW
jgi:hypothetical protein